MTKLKTLAIGAAGLAFAAATPAAAQYVPYPQTAYPQYGYQQPSTTGQVVGAIINAVTGGGYGQYPMGNYGYNVVSQRTQVQQCAIAAERRIAANHGGYDARDAYGRPVTTDAYGRPVTTDAYGRPVAVTRDAYGRPVYGAQPAAAARVLGVTSVERRANGSLRVRGVATSGTTAALDAYGRPSYGATAQADLSFNCRVNARGQVMNVVIDRNTVGYRSRY